MFMEIAWVVAERSTCERGQVAALLIRGNRIISMGYNGAPKGTPHCLEVGCDVREGDPACRRALHAEMNAIAYAGRVGTPTNDAEMFCTHSPCVACAQLIVASGVWRLTYALPYRDPHGRDFLKAHIQVHKL
jgi:dCMP deaminase